MLVDIVGRRALPSKGIHVGVISIHQDPRLGISQAFREQLGRPEDSVLGRPGFFRMAIETVDEDDTAPCQLRPLDAIDPSSYSLDLRVVRTVDFGELQAIDHQVVDRSYTLGAHHLISGSPTKSSYLRGKLTITAGACCLVVPAFIRAHWVL